MSRRVPSERTLARMLSGVLEKTHAGPDRGVRALRASLRDWAAHASGRADTLEECNATLEGFGVEYIASEDDDVFGSHGAYYVNLGDAYTPTILYDCARGSFQVTSYGDWVETQERAGRRFP